MSAHLNCIYPLFMVSKIFKSRNVSIPEAKLFLFANLKVYQFDFSIEVVEAISYEAWRSQAIFDLLYSSFHIF